MTTGHLAALLATLLAAGGEPHPELLEPGRAAPAAAMGERVPAPAVDPCLDTPTTLSHLPSEGDGHRIVIHNRSCHVEICLQGAVTLTPDLRRIAALSEDGRFVLQEAKEGVLVRLELAGKEDGRSEIDYRIDDHGQRFDATAERWLATRLLLLYRRSGLSETELDDWLLGTAGPGLLLRELEAAHGPGRGAAAAPGDANPSAAADPG